MVNKDKNNSSNSLVIGRWPQTKIAIIISEGLKRLRTCKLVKSSF